MVETKTLIHLLFELILQNRLSPMKCDCPILCLLREMAFLLDFRYITLFHDMVLL